MTALIAHGATLKCSFGTLPGTLTVLPKPATAQTTGTFLATVADTVPVTNIASFGQCLSTLNPAVQAATTAASGMFTPAPCVPATGAPWSPGSLAVAVRAQSAVPQIATCQCQWGGVVSVPNPGQVPVQTV
jgi:hypothetical protein